MFSKSVTLTELVIAMSLCGLIIMAVAVVDITSRNLFHAASRESRVQDEAKIAMEHIVKNVQLGIGDVAFPGATQGLTPYGEDILVIRQDFNTPPTPSVYSDDILIGYALDARGGHEGELFLCPDTSCDHRAGACGGESMHEIIAAGVSNFTFNIVDNIVSPTITARRDLAVAVGLDNPETTLTSSIVLRAMSCY